MTGTTNNNADGTAFLLGVLFTVLVILVVFACIDIIDGNPCTDATALLASDIRVMHTDELGNNCKLITDQGFIFYHDNMLFFEAK